MKIERIPVPRKMEKMTFDPVGFFTIMIAPDRGLIVVEHYSNVEKGTGRVVDTGRLNVVLEGSDAESLCHEIVRRGLVERLDHAAYLGRELARAQRALEDAAGYVQDGE